jgi:hypothetical protein
MKTIIDRILCSFHSIAHPANGWLRSENNPQRKRKSKKGVDLAPSPDCFDVRAGGKKQQSIRKNPAP